MSPPRRRNGGPGQPPGTAATKTRSARQQDTDRLHRNSEHQYDVLPVAFGELLPPAGRRTLSVLLVRRCPHCSHAHLHRTGQLHADYLIHVVRRR